MMIGRTRTLLLLAGGLGTRLRAVTGDGPKITAVVAGSSMLHFMLDFWFARGAERVVLALGYRSDVVLEELARWRGPTARVAASIESVPLGTGGAIRLALPQLPERFFVANADTAIDVSLTVLERMAVRRPWDALLLGSAVGAGADADLLDIAPDGALRGFLGRGQPVPGYAYAGVAALTRHLVDAAAPDLPLSFEGHMLTRGIAAGQRIGVARTNRPFHDLGTPDRLATFAQSLSASPSASETP